MTELGCFTANYNNLSCGRTERILLINENKYLCIYEVIAVLAFCCVARNKHRSADTFIIIIGTEYMEITGKIIQILEEQKGTTARGDWSRQDFIIETNEQYPKKLCISNWANKADIIGAGVGAEVTCHINLESREFNGRWYTDVKVWKMDMGASTGGGFSGGAASTSQASNDAGVPSASAAVFNKEESNDDLPF